MNFSCQVIFLGYVILRGSFGRSSKVEAINKLSQSKNSREVSSSLGLVGHYKKLEEKFSNTYKKE